jgi:hypothetical protein
MEFLQEIHKQGLSWDGRAHLSCRVDHGDTPQPGKRLCGSQFERITREYFKSFLFCESIQHNGAACPEPPGSKSRRKVPARLYRAEPGPLCGGMFTRGTFHQKEDAGPIRSRFPCSIISPAFSNAERPHLWYFYQYSHQSPQYSKNSIKVFRRHLI